MDDQTLAQALRTRIAQHEPPLGLTAAAVLRAGRRSLLRRRLTGTGGALAVVAAIVVAAGYLLTPAVGQSAAPVLIPGCRLPGGGLINSVVQQVEFYRPEWQSSFAPPRAPIDGACPVPDRSPGSYPLTCPPGSQPDGDLRARTTLTCFLRDQVDSLAPGAGLGPLQGPDGSEPLTAFPGLNGGYEASAVLTDGSGAGGLVVIVTTMPQFEQVPSSDQCAFVGCERRPDRDGAALAVFRTGGPGGFEAITVYAYRGGSVVAITSTNDDRAYGGPFRPVPALSEPDLTTLALATLAVDLPHGP
ncbi:hypothetical protein Cs7R123_28030 [Catellatospora sp. TT07R-123]|uniref:hypothetical protein n=1 Tax=Catellatospora sp. TT07R-123 TaxID=2733863 RepID=UPI001B084E13|nr:hypothetical protein [Catellatospora sp. TT07R-123]GHJ45461.1 hypothetical protein Cs7R123_28030 [Catellatospora sp. TT07R-123]